MKTFFVAVLLLMTAVIAYASGDLARTDPKLAGAGTPIDGWAPDPAKSVLVTSLASRNFAQKTKGAENLAWGFTNTGADCKGRIMGDTSKGSWPQFTIYGGSAMVRINHKNAAFLNISGCVGDYQAQ